jgi:hypothetical protein
MCGWLFAHNLLLASLWLHLLLGVVLLHAVLRRWGIRFRDSALEVAVVFGFATATAVAHWCRSPRWMLWMTSIPAVAWLVLWAWFLAECDDPLLSRQGPDRGAGERRIDDARERGERPRHEAGGGRVGPDDDGGTTTTVFPQRVVQGPDDAGAVRPL